MNKPLSVISVFALLALVLTFLPMTTFAQRETSCAADVVVQAGDTLSTLAGRYLGNLSAYTAIVEATNARAAVDASYARVTNPNAIAVGMKLCIPATSSIATGGGGLALPSTGVTTQLVATPTPFGTPTM